MHAIAAGRTATERAVACNNYGTYLFNQGRANDALRQFERIEWASAAPDTRAVCRYNYGQVLTGLKRDTDALAQYERAAAADPLYRPAVEAAVDALREKGELTRIAELASGLVTRGHADLAHKELRRILLSYKETEHPDSVRLLAAYVDCLAVLKPDPVVFADTEYWDLQALRVASATLARPIQDVMSAYGGDFRAPLDNQAAARERFSGWAGIDPEEPTAATSSFARLLVAVGDVYANPPRELPPDSRESPVPQWLARWVVRFDNKPKPAAALNRYLAAWQLDRTNADAALKAALLLLMDQREQLDPDGRRMRRLLDEMYARKGDAYRYPPRQGRPGGMAHADAAPRRPGADLRA